MTKFRIVVQDVTNSKFKHMGQVTIEAKNEKGILEKLKKTFKK